MARKKDRAPVRKREILENFYQVLVEEGLERASLARIASRMGIHPSLIIHYFSTKEKMVGELVQYILERYQETFLPQLDGIKNPRERLSVILNSVFGTEWMSLVDGGAFFSCYALSYRNQQIRESFQKMYYTLREILVEELRNCIREGVIRDGDPEKLADFIISLLEGYDYYRGLMEDCENFEELGGYLKEVVKRVLGMEV